MVRKGKTYTTRANASTRFVRSPRARRTRRRLSRVDAMLSLANFRRLATALGPSHLLAGASRIAASRMRSTDSFMPPGVRRIDATKASFFSSRQMNLTEAASLCLHHARAACCCARACSACCSKLATSSRHSVARPSEYVHQPSALNILSLALKQT